MFAYIRVPWPDHLWVWHCPGGLCLWGTRRAPQAHGATGAPAHAIMMIAHTFQHGVAVMVQTYSAPTCEASERWLSIRLSGDEEARPFPRWRASI